MLYRVRGSFPESSAFQYPEKTNAVTETNNKSGESPLSQLQFDTLKVGMAFSGGYHALLPKNNFFYPMPTYAFRGRRVWHPPGNATPIFKVSN